MDQYLTQLETFANENLVPYAWSIAAALVIFIIGSWIVARLSSWVQKLLNKRMDETVATFLGRIVHILPYRDPLPSRYWHQP